MTPRVSVIIPAYNTEVYIAQAIESVLAQTEDNIEVIVVDDSSTDATAEVARGIPDQRLKVLVNQQNLGASGARNRAIKEAKGKWIALLDSDDWYAPERLEKLLQAANSEDTDFIADDIYFIRDGEQSPWSTLLRESGQQIDTIRQIDPVYFVETDRYGQQGLHLGLTKPLIKRDFLLQQSLEYNETIKLAQDFWFYVTCLAHGARFILVPEPYYFYRSRQGSLVKGRKAERLNQLCRAAQDCLQEEVIQKNPELLSALSKNLVVFKQNKAYYSVVEPLKHGEMLVAVREMVFHPYFFIHFIKQLPKVMARRVQYYLLGNKLVYEGMYQSIWQ